MEMQEFKSFKKLPKEGRQIINIDKSQMPFIRITTKEKYMYAEPKKKI